MAPRAAWRPFQGARLVLLAHILLCCSGRIAHANQWLPQGKGAGVPTTITTTSSSYPVPVVSEEVVTYSGLPTTTTTTSSSSLSGSSSSMPAYSWGLPPRRAGPAGWGASAVVSSPGAATTTWSTPSDGGSMGSSSSSGSWGGAAGAALTASGPQPAAGTPTPVYVPGRGWATLVWGAAPTPAAGAGAAAGAAAGQPWSAGSSSQSAHWKPPAGAAKPAAATTPPSGSSSSSMPSMPSSSSSSSSADDWDEGKPDDEDASSSSASGGKPLPIMKPVAAGSSPPAPPAPTKATPPPKAPAAGPTKPAAAPTPPPTLLPGSKPPTAAAGGAAPPPGKTPPATAPASMDDTDGVPRMVPTSPTLAGKPAAGGAAAAAGASNASAAGAAAPPMPPGMMMPGTTGAVGAADAGAADVEGADTEPAAVAAGSAGAAAAPGAAAMPPAAAAGTPEAGSRPGSAANATAATPIGGFTLPTAMSEAAGRAGARPQTASSLSSLAGPEPAIFKSPGATKTILVGCLLPLSGSDHDIGGNAVLQGLKMALQDNLPKLKLSVNVNLTCLNTKCLEIPAHNAAKELAKDGAVALLGEVCSGASVAAAGVANEFKIPIISPASSSPQLTGMEYFYRTVPSDRFQGAAAAQVAREMGMKNVGVVYEDRSYGYGLAFNFIADFTRDGGSVPAVYTFKQYEGDVAAAVAKMTAAKGAKDHALDGVFLSTNNLTFGVDFLRAAADSGLGLRVIAGDSFATPSTLEIANGNASLFLNFTVTSWGKGSREFVERFSKEAPGLPYDPRASTGYDAMATWLRAYAATPEPREPKAVAPNIIKQDFKGVSGPISFDKFGDRVPHNESYVRVTMDPVTGRVKEPVRHIKLP